MKHKTSEQKRLSLKAMAELLGMPYGTVHFRWRKGYSLSDALLTPVGVPKRLAQVKHGMRGTPEYAAWDRMHQRCRSHHHYLKRGITVCERWASFQSFYEDMGKVPAGASLDRKNGRLGYSPENCRWATRREQSQNTSRNVNVTWDGQTRCVAEWARIVGKSEKTLHERLQRGWTVAQTMTLPLHARVK
jgi:hypothetical protein